MNTDRQVSTTVVSSWAAWISAVLLTIIGAVFGCLWAEDATVRMAAISLLAAGTLAACGAVCIYVRIMAKRMCEHIAGILATSTDAQARVRPFVRH